MFNYMAIALCFCLSLCSFRSALAQASVEQKPERIELRQIGDGYPGTIVITKESAILKLRDELSPDKKLTSWIGVPQADGSMVFSAFDWGNALAAWGTPRAKSKDGKDYFTFDLTPAEADDKRYFHLDATFNKGLVLNSYRLRGPGIEHPTWIVFPIE